MTVTTKTKVAIGLSGGVDSTTAAFLLKQQGYDVIGITSKVLDQQSTDKIQATCEKLGIEFKKIEIIDQFNNIVIANFLDYYEVGKTPNPCVLCNKIIKWGLMFDYAQNTFGCDYVATGHYAIIEKHDHQYKLKRSIDRRKDQTYMLINLTQKDLQYTLFPLGSYNKDHVKEIARQNKLPNYNQPESQDVCFISRPDSLQQYLETKLGKRYGNIIDCSSGEIIGNHTGVYNFTVGQRKGLKIPYPYPLYVVSIDTDTNDVYVGSREDALSNTLIATNLNWISGKMDVEKFRCLAQIRYNAKAKPCNVSLIDDFSVHVEFDEAQFAVTPGQIVAFYSLDDQYLLGGGIIQ